MTRAGSSRLSGRVGSYVVGTVGQVRCRVARTDRPWDIGIDGIVLSVGSTLGGLAQTVRDHFPKADWRSVSYSAVTPAEPVSLMLTDAGGAGANMNIAILVTPHEEGSTRSPTLNAVRTAADAAVRRASDLGVIALGMPLVGAGVVGFPSDDVARVLVPAVVKAVASAGKTSLQDVVFFCMDEKSEDSIRAGWATSLSSMGDLVRDDSVGHSDAFTIFSSEELAGGMSTDLVDPNKGISIGRDQLGVAPYVSMLASVIADRHTPLPLSVGVFGEWGSGKSYFMGMLRDTVRQLSRSGNPGYCKTIEQIGFNAWHYADSNLWASLGDEIFRQLAGAGTGVEERRAELGAELAKRLGQRRELEAATKQARFEAAKLQTCVDQAVARRERGAKELLTVMAEVPTLKKRFDRQWARLGVTEPVNQGKLLAEELRGTLTDAEALRRAPWDRRGRIFVVLAVTALVAAACVSVALPTWRMWFASAGAVFSAVAAAGITIVGRARAGLQALRELTEDLHAGKERKSTASLPDDVVEKVDELRQAEADQRIAEAQLDEVVAQVGELGRQLADLSPGRRLYSFLADRARGDSYRSNLGLISTIRKDFEQLVQLMDDSRRNPNADGSLQQPIDRIVLYIDDLDRCGPQQVVDVLQAVHLLLAMKLFVVVVGVDPRWLLRSLSCHYDQVLDLDGEQPRQGWRVTPEDYLEKILNIPLVLPGISSGSLNSLLRSMVDEHTEDEEKEVPRNLSELGSPTRVHEPRVASPSSSMTVETGSEVAAQRLNQTVEVPRPLTEPELALLATLDPLIDTPREAKRLMNLYRMLRATRDLSEASQFLGDESRPGEYQAVVLLLGLLTAHARLLGRVLDTAPDSANERRGGLVYRPQDTRWDDFVADIEPKRSTSKWTNGIVGTVPETDVSDWIRLHRGMTRISAHVTFGDLAVLQAWIPRIRRFSYLLSLGDRCD